MVLNERIFANNNIFQLFLFVVGVLMVSCANRDQEKLQLLLKGNEYLNEQDYDQAINYYDRAINLDPEFIDAYNNRGVAYLESNEPGLALESYNHAIQLKPDYYEAILNRSGAYIELGRTEPALRDLELLQSVFPDTSIVYFSIGLAKSKAREFNGAIASFKQAWVMDSSNAEIPINIGTAFYYQDSYDSAKFYLEKALEIEPEQGNAYNAMSLMAIDQGYLSSAMDLINKALDFAPNDPYFLNNRGYIHLLSDSIDLAEADINESIRIDPYNGWAYRNKGIMYIKKQQFTDAVRLLTQAVKMDNTIEAVYFHLGNAYQGAGDLGKACEAWKRSADLGEEDGGLAFKEGCSGV